MGGVVKCNACINGNKHVPTEGIDKGASKQTELHRPLAGRIVKLADITSLFLSCYVTRSFFLEFSNVLTVS